MREAGIKSSDRQKLQRQEKIITLGADPKAFSNLYSWTSAF